MNPELKNLYLRFRQHSPFMLVGHNARLALDAARTLLKFREMESDGLVRMRCEPEQENYFDVFGREDDPRLQEQLEEIIEQYGCWWTVAEWFGGKEWHQADSCGMHAGYKDPLSPFENCYIISEMESAIKAWQEHNAEVIAEECDEFDAACRDIETIPA